jgi:hypothetical protein
MNGATYVSPFDPFYKIIGYFFSEPLKPDPNPDLDPVSKALHDKIVVAFLDNCKRVYKTREAEVNKPPRIYTIMFLHLEDWGKISDEFTDIKLDKRNPTYVKEWAEEWIERIAKMAQICIEIKKLTDKKKSNPNEGDQVREDLRKTTEKLKKLSEAGRKNLDELLGSSNWPVPCQRLVQSMNKKWARLNAFRAKPEELSMYSEGVQLFVDPNSNPVVKHTAGVDDAFRGIFQIQETELFSVDANYPQPSLDTIYPQYYATVVRPADIKFSTCGLVELTPTEMAKGALSRANRIYCQTHTHADTSNIENTALKNLFPVIWLDKLPINKEGQVELRDETSKRIARVVDRAIGTIKAKINKDKAKITEKDFNYNPEIEKQAPTAMLGGGNSCVISRSLVHSSRNGA